MNKLVTLFAVPAMLGVAGISIAGNVWIEIEDWGSPHPGLHAYGVVGMVEGETAWGEELWIETIGGIALHGGLVHQVWANPLAGRDAMTPEIENCGDTFWNPAWTPMDTHRLIPPEPRTEWGIQPSETNDGSNPTHIDLTSPIPFQVYVGMAGLGEYSQPDTEKISLYKWGTAPRMDILQVVLVEGTSTLLDIRLLAIDRDQWQQFRNIPIGVPEPSTWVMLVTGLVGLLAYAWRRRGRAS